jgi:hypothetical protein
MEYDSAAFFCVLIFIKTWHIRPLRFTTVELSPPVVIRVPVRVAKQCV